MNDEQLLRYSRQIMLPGVDVAGQEKLADARILIVGLGGLGAPVALYLAAAGVGTLVLADADAVELTNLQRQIIHSTASINQPKVDSAAKALTALNPTIQLIAHPEAASTDNIEALAQGCDVLVDCTDNFTTRFLLNRHSVAHKIPLVSGAAIRLEGQISVFDPRADNSPCYRCLYSEQDDQALSCAESGVLGPLVGVIGAMQAMEAIKLVVGLGSTLAGRLLVFDAATAHWRELALQPDPACPVCAKTSRS
ncbi:MAG TPA: molybdopterin-synthase adenylyltransferase MoeB [Cellvibrionaceae bacterium]